VLNMAKDGGHYWVFAHVTPSFDVDGKQIGYHSNRRVPYPDALEKVKPLYAQLLAEEKRAPDRPAGLAKSERMLVTALRQQGIGYEEFVFSLSSKTNLDASVA